jgi:hypothetical protein
MTRGQRRAHGAIWIALALLFLGAGLHALGELRARWSESEAISP